MNYKKFVYDRIVEYKVGEPIFVKDIIKEFKKEYSLVNGNVIVPVMIGRIINEGLFLKRYKKGIYYRYEKCAFGDTVINKPYLIYRKYVDGMNGYEVGPNLLYMLGFTTLLCNLPRTFVTNNIRNNKFDKELNVRLVKSKIRITDKNLYYFQFLDVLTMISDGIPIDTENPVNLYNKFIDFYKLKFEWLMFYAVKFYKKCVVNIVMNLFEMRGGYYISS